MSAVTTLHEWSGHRWLKISRHHRGLCSQACCSCRLPKLKMKESKACLPGFQKVEDCSPAQLSSSAPPPCPPAMFNVDGSEGWGCRGWECIFCGQHRRNSVSSLSGSAACKLSRCWQKSAIFKNAEKHQKGVPFRVCPSRSNAPSLHIMEETPLEV